MSEQNCVCCKYRAMDDEYEFSICELCEAPPSIPYVCGVCIYTIKSRDDPNVFIKACRYCAVDHLDNIILTVGQQVPSRDKI